MKAEHEEAKSGRTRDSLPKKSQTTKFEQRKRWEQRSPEKQKRRKK